MMNLSNARGRAPINLRLLFNCAPKEEAKMLVRSSLEHTTFCLLSKQ